MLTDALETSQEGNLLKAWTQKSRELFCMNWRRIGGFWL